MFTKIKSLSYYLLRYPYYKIIFGKIGTRTKIQSILQLEYPKNIYIGSSVNIGKHAWLAANPLTEAVSCRLTIMDGTYIGNFAHIYATNEVIIESKVLIADRVYIADNSHGYQNIDMAIIDQPIQQLKPVRIGKNAWIGEGVAIIGCNVGQHSLIGANAVVTKDIPDYCIAVGAPAKVIKRYSFDKKEWLKTNDKGEFIS